MYPGGGGQPPDCGEIVLYSGSTLAVPTVSKGEDGISFISVPIKYLPKSSEWPAASGWMRRVAWV